MDHDRHCALRLANRGLFDALKWSLVAAYGGNGIWHWSGYVMEPDYLAIPAALKSRLADWAER